MYMHILDIFMLSQRFFSIQVIIPFLSFRNHQPMSSSTASSSNTQNPERMEDQVFLSFTPEDVEVEEFILTLHMDLTMSGIRTCYDKINALRGVNQNSLRRSNWPAIDGSRLSVVVFSEHYGGSSECLEELEKIMECHRATGHVVLLVLHGVDLWDVRKQKGRFGQEFERMVKDVTVEEHTVLNWRRALSEAAFLCAGFTSRYHFYRDMSITDFIRMVLDGIWGKGGIGKTSIAKVIYNRMFESFEGSSFVANIKDVWKQDKGEDYLRTQLLSDINSTTDMAVHSTEVEKILAHKRVLVVLDDVSNTDQLISLCGSRKRFGVGSIIMITTREKQVLDLFELDVVYEMKEMDPSKSLELFSWHAFKHYIPTDDWIQLSRKAISFCGGLPLALEVLGSLLLDRTASQWKSILKLLKRNQSNEVLNILKLSYDFLDDNEKKVFIEIACFYMGKDRHNVTQLLSGCGLAAETGISKLIERSLLKVDKNNKLEMHDLVQEMGRELNRLKPKSKWIHTVFLSFRGLDTRRSFTSHLYAALQHAGIEVYMDDKLKRGENISSSLLQAIEGSRVSIIIFSVNYANSIWCLQELEKIMECHRAIGQEVVPVFYGVEPSEVRKQIGSFGQALDGLVQRISATKDMIVRWKRALTEAANLSGWNLNSYRTEIEMISDIVKTVTTRLDDNTYLFVADHPVGVESRVQDMVQLLSGKSNEVRIVGILGMGGSGKTTIAKAIYNEINQNFDGKTFLANIREVWDQDDGRVYLQEQLLSGILRTRRMKLHTIELGKTIIKEKLCHKRALVVLDDINNLDQVNALCGSREWFGQGSRLIITTRDEHLLKVLQVDHIYRTQEMDESESLELFSWHAFKQAAPNADFVGLSRMVVAYSGRLPLALEVLGSCLFERKIAEWESTLMKLEVIPNDQIQKKLKLSYDGLSDDMEKDIFLDICCFFIGKDRNYVAQILDGCGLHAEIGITVLIERSLVKVDKNNKLQMHDLLKVMGREIIREMSPTKPEERSRLWFHDDVVDMMTNNTATIAVKGLACSLPKNNDVVFETKAFKKMKRLRLLQLGHVNLTGDFEYLSKDLRWLCWHGFPLGYLPGSFCPKSSVAIDLKHSNLQLVWKEPQLLDRLKFLNLSHSHHLTQTPDFSRLPNLEKLILKDCPQLSTVHSTIGDLKYLKLVNLKDCKSLSDLPRSIYKLKSLKSLVLSGCSKLYKLEEDIMQMESLTSLLADGTAITQVPFSLMRLKSIKHVSICGYEGLSSHIFPSLIFSGMSPRNLMYKVFGSISSSLQSLSLGSAAMSRAELELRTQQITHIETHPSIDCHNSIHSARSENFTSSLIIQAGECCKATDTLTGSISQGWTNDGSGDCDCSFPSDTKCLTFKGESSSVWFKVPITDCTLKGVTLHIIYSSSLDNLASECDLISVSMINYTNDTIHLYKRDKTTSVDDEEWQGLMSSLGPGDEVEVVIVFGHRFVVKKTIVHLIYGESAN
ncbi:disease resistance protein RUN1-like isoform X2 [Lotus japonicus]|uniref:disease resistance protein RUN1-like isoform X2 n=1 Tax=Lotus japonicus TaxID=34305 RepID=UPI002586F6D5|nr:disease resistance protein RUN1-like isoform X2 [Lotus japonicus]